MSRRRRWVIGLVATVVVIALVAAAGWFLAVPNWRPPLRDGERYGVDVASHQGHIDWPAVARDEIDFAYIKATEGSDFIDRRFSGNWQESTAAGIDRGAYHFFTLCSPGASQARHFIDVARPDPEALRPAVDLELAGNCSARPPRAKVVRELHEFIRMVEDAWGRPLVLYVGDDWDRAYPTRASFDRPLWHRRILLRPDVAGWVIWQIHGMAHVEGINGPVDINIMRASA
ncbi:MAG: glycosyl hydrolase 25 family protein [Acidimicrobiales bacterium]|nr:glycosyl hydrolase 25 family protein [Acidimicrobiales bacterium]